MNILDDILNKIKDLNVYYITTKDNVETYLYYNNKNGLVLKVLILM